MYRFRFIAAGAVLALGLVAFCPMTAQAQITVYYNPPVFAPPPLVVPAQVVTYYQPPAVVYSAPRVSYYQPVTVYSAPAVSTGGAYVTRSFRGYGIFRPRGVYTQSYYQPTVTYSPSIRTTYYQPVIWP